MHGEAVHKAREVVGLYGDPDTSWAIGLDTRWARPVDVAVLSARLADLADEHPHLGGPATVSEVAEEDWQRRRIEVLATPYEIGAPLVRCLATAEGTRLMVGAHHGAMDGFGMVAVLERITGRAFRTSARGVPRGEVPGSFLRSSVRRLVEALVAPPPRFGGLTAAVPGVAEPEHVADVALPRLKASTPVLSHAVARAYAGWPGARAADRPLLVTGVSHRDGGQLLPDRQTGYVRFRVRPGWDLPATVEAFRRLVPEPDFPETSAGGLGPRIVRLLRSRLGSTAQVSNIGVLGADGLDAAYLFPAVSGPMAVSLGAASTETTTTLTVRTRSAEFSEEQTLRLLEEIRRGL